MGSDSQENGSEPIPGEAEAGDPDFAEMLQYLRTPESKQKAADARQATEELARRQAEFAEMLLDPSSDASRWLAEGFLKARKTLSDPDASDREWHLAELEVRMRIELHTAWKARQMARQNAETTDVVTRELVSTTKMLAFATIGLVLATIGLVIVAIVVHS